MRFTILGSTQLHVAGRSIDLGPAKRRAVLTLLLYHAGKPVPIEVLVGELWPGKTHEDVRRNIWQHISRIRTTLERAGVPAALKRISGSYRLDVDPLLVDFHLFGRLVRHAGQALAANEHETAAGQLREAIDLWQGPPLADLNGEWSSLRRDHITETMLLGAHKQLFAAQLALGQHHEVLDQLGPLLHDHPLDETFAQQWISALDRSGRAPEVSRFYLSFRSRWLQEMGAPPGDEVEDAYRRSVERPERPRAYHVDAAAKIAHTEVAVPRQLPRDICDFTGHQELLTQLDNVVESAGTHGCVVMLDGMPAVGKTTLATHWAHRRRDLFPHGQLYLDLRGHGPSPPIGPSEASGRFLSALGLPKDRMPASRSDRQDRLRQLLDGRQVLIVVDNARDSRQVRPLMTATANCTMLITSRNRLRGLAIRDGVHGFTVPPLAPEQAASLLQSVLGAHLVDHDNNMLLEYAALSGGVPLAVRIIAQHAAERPRTDLADLVGQLRRRLLTLGSETGDEDSTLRAVFTYSYQDLPPQAGQLFRLASLHPGRCFSAESASALCGTDIDQAEHALDILTRAHLLEHDTARRFRFHDLLRRFASERVRDQESAEAQHSAINRLLDWYLLSAVNAVARITPQRPAVPDLPANSLAQPLSFDTHAAAMRWCEEERENITAATRCAAEHGFHHYAWQIPGTVHEIYERYGPQDDVLESSQIALTSARTNNHLVAQLGSLNNLGVAHHWRRDDATAAAHLEEGIRIALELGHRKGEAVTKHNLANIHVKRGEFESAIRLYEQARLISHDIGDDVGEAYSLHRLGKAHRHMGRLTEALEYHRQALTIREEISHERGQGSTHAELAALRKELGEFDTALEHAQLALALCLRTKDQTVACDALIARAATRLQIGRLTLAMQDARRAAELCDEIADSHRRARALNVLAKALAASGDHDLAHQVQREEQQILNDVATTHPGHLSARSTS